MKVVIDGDKCTGHGRCYALAPTVFDADDDGFGVVIAADRDLDPEGEEHAARAAANCPESAIRLES